MNAPLAEVAPSVPIEGFDRVFTMSRDQDSLWIAGISGPNAFAVASVDPDTLTPVSTLPAPGLPSSLTVTRQGGRTWVDYLDYTSGRTIRVDAQTGSSTRGSVIDGEPVGMVVTPDGGRGFLPLNLAGAIAVVDLATGEQTCRIPASGGVGDALALADDGVRIFAGVVTGGGSTYQSGVEVLDRGTGETLAIFDTAAVSDLALSPDQSVLVGVTFASVIALDANTGEILGEIDIDGRPDRIIWDPAGQYAYAWSYLDSELWVIDVPSSRIVTTFRIPSETSDVIVDAGGGFVAGRGMAALSR